jgi:hypothetical protein
MGKRKRKTLISKYIVKEHIPAGVIIGIITALVCTVVISSARAPIHIAERLIAPAEPEREAARVVGGSWGPPRILYRCKPNGSCDGPNHVQFNSVINRLILGDERYFLGAKVLGTKETPRHTVIVKPGDSVQISAVVVNDDNFSGPRSIAHGTKFRLVIPTNSAKVIPIIGHISAENAQPSDVQDSLYLRSDKRFSVEYLSESAMLVPSSIPGESHLSDSVVGEGALIGYQYTNGIFPGCECDSATVELALYIGPPKWSPPEEATSVN